MLQTDTSLIRAKDGVVTLSGILETEPQKAAAGEAAESLSWIKKVYNAIHVRTPPFQKEQDELIKENRERLCRLEGLCLRRKEWPMRITVRNAGGFAISSFT